MTTPPAMFTLAAEFDAASREQWLKLVDKVLKGADFDKRLVSATYDGVRIAPLYSRDELTGFDEAPAPGNAPFTRGGTGTTAAWDIRQRHAESDPEKANGEILKDLEGGVTSLTIQCEAPGQFGLPTEPAAFARALEGVFLDLVPVALEAGERVEEAAKALIQVWTDKSIAMNERRGAFNADPLASLAKLGSTDVPTSETVGKIADLAMPMPGVTALLADGRPYHAGGASEAQELGAMLGCLVTYLRMLGSKGLTPDKALPKIAVALTVDADQFLGIAKLRAARKLIWRVADACGAGAKAGQVPIVAETAWRMMAKRDPSVNLLRTTIACSAAAIGGANAITVLPFTAALGKPDAFARRIARNTQIVLMEESGLGRVADPAGGAWYVETLTEELARKAWEFFQQIEGQKSAAGQGMPAALASGFVQDAIGKTAQARRKNLATAREALTGVSAFPKLGADGIDAEPYPELVGKSAGGGKPLTAGRLAAPFEDLRDRADAMAKAAGKPPKVFLATLGALGDFSARATWTRNFFAVGGIESVGGEPYADAEAAAAAFRASGASIACLCASDAVYATMAVPAASALTAAGARTIYLAGRPGDNKSAMEAAGVAGFVHAGVDMVQVLDGVL